MHTGLPDWWSLFILHLQNIIHQLRGSQLNASSTSGWQCVVGGINKNSTWPSVDVLLCVLFFFSPPIKPIYLCVHVFIYIHCKIGKIGDIPHTQSHTHITHIYYIYICTVYLCGHQDTSWTIPSTSSQTHNASHRKIAETNSWATGVLDHCCHRLLVDRGSHDETGTLHSFLGVSVAACVFYHRKSQGWSIKCSNMLPSKCEVSSYHQPYLCAPKFHQLGTHIPKNIGCQIWYASITPTILEL